MQHGDDRQSVLELLGALDQARASRARTDLTRTVAVLWTWLERHMQLLGSLLEKSPAIRAAAMAAPAFAELDDATLAALEREPLRNAAELLARIDLSLVDHKTFILDRAYDVDGNEVFVAWRSPSLAIAAHKDREDVEKDRPVPPEAMAHPSLSTLAPNLLVCPVVIGGKGAHGIKLKVPDMEGQEWLAARKRLDAGMAGHPMLMKIHLDALGEHGMSGWLPTGERVGCFDPEQIKAEDEVCCIAAVEEAVRCAAGTSSVLLMPELAATPKVLGALERALAKNRDAPALTVVGLYHGKTDLASDSQSALVGDSALASRVNEAVVLGPGGKELWRQRKLSYAQGRTDPDGVTDPDDMTDLTAEPATEDVPLVEDIRLGDELEIVPTTSLGTIAVPICLDIIASAAKARILSSPTEVLLIPSLSPTLHRHRYHLHQMVQVLWAIGFVCNRWVKAPENGETVWNEFENRSFWMSQRESARIPAPRPPGDRPCFVFSFAPDSDTSTEGVELLEQA